MIGEQTCPGNEGGLKDQALESVTEVLEALSTLAGGTAGLAILHGYLAQIPGGQIRAAEAVRR